MKNFKKLMLVLTAIAMVSCGEKKEKEQIKLTDQPAETTESVTQEKSAQDENVVEITITGNDQMQFNMAEMKVKAGQTVRITLKHIGKMDKNVMGHNWVLLTQGTEIGAFGQAAVAAKATDYVPAGTTQVIAHTKLLSGGESDTIEFVAPAAGTYDFICSFPGHYAIMKGKFIVE
ncbi:MAG: azurin [Flavobacteriaceae bacterium]|nr:azurin [Flavobacteriaceae bacterium]